MTIFQTRSGELVSDFDKLSANTS